MPAASTTASARWSPARFADIAVLNGDPFQAGVADLKDVEADLTLLAGRVVFDRQGEVR